MFAALFKRAQASVDNAIGQAVNRMLVAIPFFIAGGFSTFGIYARLERTYGPEWTSYFIAGGFLLLGLFAAAIFRPAASVTISEDNSAAAVSEMAATADAVGDGATEPMSKADRELLLTALTSAAPIAVPAIVRGLLRNLPLFAVILAALLIFFSGNNSPDEQRSSPAAN